MCVLPFRFLNGHYFLECDGELWLLDTGAPSSFGSRSRLDLADQMFTIDDEYLGLTPGSLVESVGVSCQGLLGSDVLSQFDLRLDAQGVEAKLTTSELPILGERIDLDQFLGLPIVPVTVNGASHRFFFDTGAQLSYFMHPSLGGFPPAGQFADFYPGFGSFETETYDVEVTLGATEFVLRCGSLPRLLGATLMMAGTDGIVGNQVLQHQPVLYAPRRRLLVLEPRTALGETREAHAK